VRSGGCWGALRALVVMPRCESAKILERARWVVRVTVNRSYQAEDRQLVGESAQYVLGSASQCSFTVVALAAKEVPSPSFQAPLQAPSRSCLALPSVARFPGPPDRSNKFFASSRFLTSTFLARRIATKLTHRAPSGVSLPLWEKVPGHQFFNCTFSNEPP
jgi:hypothetical protein